MRLTDWDEDTIEEYRQRWEKVRGLGGDAAFVGLAQLLSTHPKWPVDPKLLRHLTGSNNRARLYGTATLPKKRGGMRTLTIPVRKLRWVQRSVLQVITHLFPSHKCARGFVRGESIVSHAALHANKRWVYTVDIEDFFPSITWARLYGMFQSFPFNVSQDVARLLCNLTTYDDALPQGAPSSPILANLLCRKLDSRLYQWARKNGYTYSRYADDLTFSTNKRQFSEDDRAFIDRIIDEEQFKVNPSKRRLMSRGERQMVTGLVVNDKVSLPRSYVRGLRALLHNVERHGWKSQVYRSVLPLDDDTRDAYRARALEPGALKKVRQKQREGHHYLISPMASMPKAKDVKSFQRVVRGKIEFLGLVKGREDDSLYQDLLNHFTFLLAFEDQVDTSYAELRREVRKVDPAYAKRLGQYRRFDRAIRQLSEAELTDYLQGLADQTLEFGWLNNQAGNLDERKKEARRIAYAALMSPALTASFFRYFRRRESFSGILHAPTASDVDAQTMLANSEAIFRVYENFRFFDKSCG